jgi:hypothetical protein
MKTNWKNKHHVCLNALIFILFIICLTSCGSAKTSSPSTTNNTQTTAANGELTVPEHLKGKWISLNGYPDVYLGSTTKYTIEVIEENLIKLKDPNQKTPFFATRFGTQQAKLSMVVAKHGNAGSKGVSGIGGLEVILQDLNDKENHKVTHTGNDGSVSVDGMTSGNYSVKISENDTYSQTNITCDVTSSTDLAIVTPSEKGDYSFKSELASDQEFIYGDYATYTGNIKISNIGVKDAMSLKYELSVESNSHIILIDDDETNLSAVIGTIEPGVTKWIKVKYKTRFLSDTGATGDYFNDKIHIVLTDMYNRQWYHYVPMKIYRRSVVINTDSDLTSPYSSESGLEGIIIFPDRYLKRIPTWKKFSIPLSTDTPYKFILSNLTADKEKKYSIGIDTACNTRDELTQFTDTGKDEIGVGDNTTGNDTESTAITLKTGDKYMAYLHKQDIDYYLINMNDSPKEPVILTVDETKNSYSLYDTTSTKINTTGNSDKKINPGESVNLNLAITNRGNSMAYGVITCLSLTSNDGYVTIPDEWSCSNNYPPGIGDIGGGITKGM